LSRDGQAEGAGTASLGTASLGTASLGTGTLTVSYGRGRA
jgi:hypothetical protein